MITWKLRMIERVVNSVLINVSPSNVFPSRQVFYQNRETDFVILSVHARVTFKIAILIFRTFDDNCNR